MRKIYLTVLLLIIISISSVTSTLAYFYASATLENEGEIGEIELTSFINPDNQTTITNPISFTYTSIDPISNPVAVTNTSTISSYMRYRVTFRWVENDESTGAFFEVNTSQDWADNPVILPFATIPESFYYNNVVAPGEQVTLFDGITFSSATDSKHDGWTLNITVTVEAIQANASGQAIFSNEAPETWAFKE